MKIEITINKFTDVLYLFVTPIILPFAVLKLMVDMKQESIRESKRLYKIFKNKQKTFENLKPFDKI